MEEAKGLLEPDLGEEEDEVVAEFDICLAGCLRD